MSAFVGFIGFFCRRCQTCQSISDLNCQFVGNIYRFRTGVLPIVLDLNQPRVVALNTEYIDGLGAICDRLKLIAIEGPVIVLLAWQPAGKLKVRAPSTIAVTLRSPHST